MYTTATLRNVRCFYAKSVELTAAAAYSTVAELYRSNAAAACWIFSAPERYREGQCVVVVQTTSEFQLVLDSAIMEIIKSIRTWKPLKKSKSAQSNKSCPKSAQSVQNSVGSDSSDNYCYSGTVVQCSSQENNSYVQENNSYVLSQTSLVSASSVAASDSLYSPAPARPASVAASSGYHKVEPLTKPPPHFLRPKQQPQSQPQSQQPQLHHMYQGKKQQHKSHISIFQ